MSDNKQVSVEAVRTVGHVVVRSHTSRGIQIAFVNESISVYDKANFDFSRIKRPPLYYVDPIEAHYWTIDRTRDVFLIWTLGGNEEARNAHHVALWWHGDLVRIGLERDAVGQNRMPVTSTWRLRLMQLPSHLESSRAEIVEALKEALTEYKVTGAGVRVASHEAKFEF